MIYVGTVSGNGSVKGNGKGIYTLSQSDTCLQVVDCLEADNASVIKASADRKVIYAANESKNFGGINGAGGGITACRIMDDGRLEKINDSIAYGSRTAYVEPTSDNRYLLVANHGSHTTVTCSYERNRNGEWRLKRGFDESNVALFSLREDGGIGGLLDLVAFEIKGYWCHGGGQSTSHIHCVRTRDDLVFACNRGADEIEVLKIDRHANELVFIYSFFVRSGYAPRYLEFHPHDSIIYVANENYPSVSVYRYDAGGKLTELQMLGTMPEEYYIDRPLPKFDKRHADPGEKNTSGFADRGAAMPSDIHISQDGRFLYVSNRGPKGNIAVFRVNQDHTLSLRGHIFIDSKDPRGFALNGDLLYVGLLDRNTMQVFLLDKESGLVSKHLYDFGLPAPSSFVI